MTIDTSNAYFFSARFHQLKMQQLEEQRQEETRLRDQETSKSFPRTREDFDQLYAMVISIFT